MFDERLVKDKWSVGSGRLSEKNRVMEFQDSWVLSGALAKLVKQLPQVYA
jgi:hypothetical protein